MMLAEHYRLAMNSVRSRRVRSMMTLIGIIIGVVSVITIFSMGEGVKRQVLGEAERLGGDVLTIKPGNSTISGSPISSLGGGVPAGGSLSEQDIETIKKVDGVSQVVPLAAISGLASLDNRSFDKAIIVGTSPTMPQLANVKIEFGQFFGDDESTKQVVVIGPRVAEKIFDEPIPIGKSLKIRDQDFIVRGVLERSQAGLLGTEVDFNNTVLMPYETAKILSSDSKNIYEILVKTSDRNNVNQVSEKLNSDLKQTRGGQQDFAVIKPGDSLLVANSVVRLVTNLVGALAIISMLIGGVSIMNIMLVSVTERTHEIGIRKAVGATNKQIRTQFMMEAVVLSLWGAFLGLICAGLVNLVIRILTNFQPVITWQPVLASLVFSVTLGIIFGTAPAIKASLKDPIEALRSGE